MRLGESPVSLDRLGFEARLCAKKRGSAEARAAPRAVPPGRTRRAVGARDPPLATVA